jgi:hypothetical protein
MCASLETPKKKSDSQLLTEFCAKNQQLVDLVVVVDNSSSKETKKRDPYLTNVGIVARYRLELATRATNEKQLLEKLCNRGSLEDAIKEAERELERVAEYCHKT